MTATKKGVLYELKDKPNYPDQTIVSTLTMDCPYESDALSLRFDRHLHLVSDEKIEKDDWCVRVKKGVVEVVKNLGVNIEHIENTRSTRFFKIMATTDSELSEIKVWDDFDKKVNEGELGEPDMAQSTIPLIPISVVKDYVKANGEMTELEIEYYNEAKGWQMMANHGAVGSTQVPDNWIPKVDENNYIIL